MYIGDIIDILLPSRRTFNTRIFSQHLYTMGFKKNNKPSGHALAEVLPRDSKPWYRVPHLLKLNLLLLIPLMSSSVAGFDGNSPVPTLILL
jgi:hypothetical protein